MTSGTSNSPYFQAHQGVGVSFGGGKKDSIHGIGKIERSDNNSIQCTLGGVSQVQSSEHIYYF